VPTWPTNQQSKCPRCGHGAAEATGISEAPKEGDLAICISCLGLNIYQGDLSLRAPSPAEESEALQDPTVSEIIQEYRAAIQAIRGQRN
jgi:hypothetical protein